MEYKFKNSYKTISEVVRLLNMNTKKNFNNQTHTLRYWEKQFKQIKPIKIKNRRYYDKKNIDIVPNDLIKVNRSLNGSRFNKLTGYKVKSWPLLIKDMHEFELLRK